MTKNIAMVLIAVTLIFVFAATASANQQATDIIVDVLLVRPLSLAATAVGTAVFIASLPFSVPSGSVNDTARTLVAEPFKYTFSRPIGDFGRAPYYPVYVDYYSETSGRNTAVNPQEEF